MHILLVLVMLLPASAYSAKEEFYIYLSGEFQATVQVFDSIQDTTSCLSSEDITSNDNDSYDFMEENESASSNDDMPLELVKFWISCNTDKNTQSLLIKLTDILSALAIKLFHYYSFQKKHCTYFCDISSVWIGECQESFNLIFIRYYTEKGAALAVAQINNIDIVVKTEPTKIAECLIPLFGD